MHKNEGLNSNFDFEFAAPITIGNERVVTVKEAVSQRTENKWANSVIVYIFGNRSYYHHFKAFVGRAWNPLDNFKIYTRNDGFFIIRFSNAADCEKTTDGGLYFIDEILIILKRLAELNLKLWKKEAFSAIASVVGVPLKLDEQTAKESRLGYARILAKINAKTELLKEAYIMMHNGENLIQEIEYEWIPKVCKPCLFWAKPNSTVSESTDAPSYRRIYLKKTTELETGKPMSFKESFVAWHTKREKAKEKGKAKRASVSTCEFVDNKSWKVYGYQSRQLIELK